MKLKPWELILLRTYKAIRSRRWLFSVIIVISSVCQSMVLICLSETKKCCFVLFHLSFVFNFFGISRNRNTLGCFYRSAIDVLPTFRHLKNFRRSISQYVVQRVRGNIYFSMKKIFRKFALLPMTNRICICFHSISSQY